MKRQGRTLGALLALILVAVLVGAAVTLALALHGDIEIIRGIIPKKTAGVLVEFGKFSASSLVVRGTVGDVYVVKANVSGIVVKSNLPINVSFENGVLEVYCPIKEGIIGKRNICNDYKNGTVVVEVGGELEYLGIRDAVGEFLVSAGVKRITVRHVVGDFDGQSWAGYTIENSVGDITLHASDHVSINNVVGDIIVIVPPDFGVALNAEDVVGDVKSTTSGNNGTIVVSISNVVGDVSIKG
ncbi:hypothetical protein E3E35_05515 [Thermococcus sp. GR7]|uniref:hypothetical protein n=1 Tax=unclassified Thermococcus TaxID=2627626 RepID=UPI0014306DEB|nr:MULTISPECIES: hypothetical protein [unclassified Thermococcus]NJE46877.1 hypothetical protein [Thermococcus sp. GR7]NJE78374.1 hypothetical protein [Thermococcus sp. GR4]NJF23329.1 hypothetical protein [Thermococcus sp. GR5]